jgi:hypothetical protein
MALAIDIHYKARSMDGMCAASVTQIICRSWPPISANNIWAYWVKPSFGVINPLLETIKRNFSRKVLKK